MGIQSLYAGKFCSELFDIHFRLLGIYKDQEQGAVLYRRRIRIVQSFAHDVAGWLAEGVQGHAYPYKGFQLLHRTYYTLSYGE